MASYQIAARVGTTAQFDPSQNSNDRQKEQLITMWAYNDTLGDQYHMNISTGTGGFSDSVNTAALMTTAAVETRQRQETELTNNAWMEYSDLLSAIFNRLRQASTSVVEESSDADNPIANDIFLQIMKHSPVTTQGSNDSLAKECIKHFLNEELLRTTGRLVIDHSKWAKPMQWANTVRLAQSGLAVDPDNVPQWESTMHHSNLAEHRSELATVLNLTESALFCTDFQLPCIEYDDDNLGPVPHDPVHYVSTRRGRGANMAAWLWNALVTEGSTSAAIDKLERAHTTHAPFGHVKISTINFAHEIYSKLHNIIPLLAIAEPAIPLTGHTPTVSFGKNYVSGKNNELTTWGIGVASTAIEEALQLAVASLYLFDWKFNSDIAPQTKKLGHIKALLSAPLLQGQNVSIENAGIPRIPYEVQLDMKYRPNRNDEMVKEIFKKIADGLDAARSQEGALSIEVGFDYLFYTRASNDWDPDVGYRTSYEQPKEVYLSGAASANEAMNAIIDTLRGGFSEVESFGRSVKVIHGERTVDRDWVGGITIRNADDFGYESMLQENTLRFLDRVWKRQNELKPTNVVWQDPSLAAYPERGSSWNSSSFGPPPGASMYIGRSRSENYSQKSGLEKAIINYMIQGEGDSVKVHLTATSDESEYVVTSKSIKLRMEAENKEAVELKICGAMKSANWNLDFTQLTKSAALNSKGKLVYFDRYDAVSYERYEREEQERQRHLAIGRSELQDDEESEIDARARIMLSDLKIEHRKNVQVYYEHKENGHPITYCGVTHPEKQNYEHKPVHVFWEDGAEGDILPSNLIVTAHNVRNKHAKLMTPLNYEYENMSKTATFNITFKMLKHNVQSRGVGFIVAVLLRNKTDKEKLKILQGIVLTQIDEPKLYLGTTPTNAKPFPLLSNDDNTAAKFGKICYLRYSQQDKQEPVALSGGFFEEHNMQFTLQDLKVIALPDLAIKVPEIPFWTKIKGVANQNVQLEGSEKSFELKKVFLEPVNYVPSLPTNYDMPLSIKIDTEKYETTWPTTIQNGSIFFTDNTVFELIDVLMKFVNSRQLVADTFVIEQQDGTVAALSQRSLQSVAVPGKIFLIASVNKRRFAKIILGDNVLFADTKRDENDISTGNAVLQNDAECDAMVSGAVRNNNFVQRISDASIPAKNIDCWSVLQNMYRKGNSCSERPPMKTKFDLKNALYYTKDGKKTRWSTEIIRGTNWPTNVDGTLCEANLYKTWYIDIKFGHHDVVSVPMFGSKSIHTIKTSALYFYRKWMENLDLSNHKNTLFKKFDNDYDDVYVKYFILKQTHKDNFISRQWLTTENVNSLKCDDIKSFSLVWPFEFKQCWLSDQIKSPDLEHTWSRRSIPLVLNPQNRLENWAIYYAEYVDKGFNSSKIFKTNDTSEYLCVAFPGDSTERYLDGHSPSDREARVIIPTSIEEGKLLNFRAETICHLDLSMCLHLQGETMTEILNTIDTSFDAPPGTKFNPYSLDMRNALLKCTTNEIDTLFTKYTNLRQVAIQAEIQGSKIKVRAHEVTVKNQLNVVITRLFELLKTKPDECKTYLKEHSKSNEVRLKAPEQKKLMKKIDEMISIANEMTSEKFRKFYKSLKKSYGMNADHDDDFYNFREFLYAVTESNSEQLHDYLIKNGRKYTQRLQTNPLPVYKQISVDEVFNITIECVYMLHRNFLYLVNKPGLEDHKTFKNFDLSQPPSIEKVEIKRARVEEPTDEAPDFDGNAGGYRRALDAVLPKYGKKLSAGAVEEATDLPAFATADEEDGSAYTRWRHVMEDNMRYAQYFRDPLPGHTTLTIRVIPNSYTVRANNRRTRQRLTQALMEGKVLHVPHFEYEHVESADGRLCWDIVNHRIKPVPNGAHNNYSYVVQKGRDEVHNSIANSFGGWHFARATETRQTAHANLMGSLAQDALKYLNESTWVAIHKDVDPNFLPSLFSEHRNLKNKYTQCYTVFEAIQSAAPTLVTDSCVLIKGPGRDAVATACRIPAVKIMSHLGLTVCAEVNHQLVAVAMALPKRIAPNTYGARVRREREADCKSYFTNPMAHASLVRVFVETALADSVRAGAGKRYHHNLPVRAGQIALRSALHDLLLVTDPEV